MTGLGVPLHTHGTVRGVDAVEIVKVLEPIEARGSHLSASDVLLWHDESGRPTLTRPTGDPVVSAIRDPNVVRPGDVVRLRPGSSMISVLYRRGSKSNSLFTTERCNSLCLMCSQPPRDVDDSWRVAELLRLVSLIDSSEPQLGITGGEPTLLGDGLDAILQACSTYLPETGLHILSNGRAFADRTLAERLAPLRREQVTWAIPVYGDVAAIHDEVVDVAGAFEETLAGLFELGRLGAHVEIRVVLHKLTVGRLPELASFIYRRLPFVRHVALMGLEPMGFTKGNRDRLWIDPVDYMPTLQEAVAHLANRGMATSIYNLPLCVLPRALWPFARQSISDWKNHFAPECGGCVVADHCAGFFASAGAEWRSRDVRPLSIEELAA